MIVIVIKPVDQSVDSYLLKIFLKIRDPNLSFGYMTTILFFFKTK